MLHTVLESSPLLNAIHIFPCISHGWCHSMCNIFLHRCPVIYLISPITKNLFPIFYYCEQYCNKQSICVDFLHFYYFYCKSEWLKMVLYDHLEPSLWFCSAIDNCFLQRPDSKYFRHRGPRTIFIAYSFFVLFCFYKLLKMLKTILSSWTLQKQSVDRIWSAGHSLFTDEQF